jgi:hypothetical protein
MERTYDYGCIATEDFDYCDEEFTKGQPVPDDVYADMWAESGGSANARFQMPMKRKG